MTGKGRKNNNELNMESQGKENFDKKKIQNSADHPQHSQKQNWRKPEARKLEKVEELLQQKEKELEKLRLQYVKDLEELRQQRQKTDKIRMEDVRLRHERESEKIKLEHHREMQRLEDLRVRNELERNWREYEYFDRKEREQGEPKRREPKKGGGFGSSVVKTVVIGAIVLFAYSYLKI